MTSRWTANRSGHDERSIPTPIPPVGGSPGLDRVDEVLVEDVRLLVAGLLLFELISKRTRWSSGRSVR
jgi:hypothetical protein